MIWDNVMVSFDEGWVEGLWGEQIPSDNGSNPFSVVTT